MKVYRVSFSTMSATAATKKRALEKLNNQQGPGHSYKLQMKDVSVELIKDTKAEPMVMRLEEIVGPKAPFRSCEACCVELTVHDFRFCKACREGAIDHGTQPDTLE